MKLFFVHINIKVCFFESIDATFSWSGVLIELYHGNISFQYQLKTITNDYFYLKNEGSDSNNVLLICLKRRCCLLCHLFCSILPTFRGGLTKKGLRRLFSLWPFLFSHSEPPLWTENPLWGNIEPFPVILSPCPYTVLPANIYQHSFFSKSQIFPSISWHRCNIPCWELDSTSHIIRFSFHSNTGALSSSSGV